MKSELDIKNFNMPYGVLHDQILKRADFKDNKMIFTFDIEIYPQDFLDDTYYERFKNFRYCDMIVELTGETDNCFWLESCLDNKGRYKGLEIDVNEFLAIADKANYLSFNTCMTNGNELQIDFFLGFYDAKGKYRKYKNFAMCHLKLPAEKIIWNWY